jgi:type IV pilus assembly protein PilF
MTPSKSVGRTLLGWLCCLLAATCFSGGCATHLTQKQHDTARINYDLGIASLNKGDTQEALRALLLAVAADPELPQPYNALGLVMHTLGKDAEALKHYRTALTLQPNFSEASNNMGILLLDTGDPHAAIAAFRTALSNILYTTPYLAEGNMGWAYYKLNDLPQALEHINAAVAAQPLFCRGYEWLARIALEQDTSESAREMVLQSRRFVRHCLEDPVIATTIAADYRREMQYYLGLGQLKLGRKKLAAQQFAQCARGFDKNLYSHDGQGDGEDESEERNGRMSGFARKFAHAAQRLAN